MSTTPGCGTLLLDTVTVFALPLMWGWALSVLWSQNAVPLGAMPLGEWQAVGLVALGMALKLLVTGLPKSAEYEPGEGVKKATTTGLLLLFLLGLSSLAGWMAA